MALTSCAPGPVQVTMPGSIAVSGARVPGTIRVQVHEGAAVVVREVPLEQYVEATILAEAQPDESDGALVERLFEVQAIIARTYAVANAGRHAREGFDLCSTTHCQLYEPGRLRTSRWTATAQEAARRTAGKLVRFRGQPANVLFHADCGGHTSDAAAVWGGAAVPYLLAAPDICPADHSEWTFDARTTVVRDALNADVRTQVGTTLDRIEVAGRDEAGRAELITLHGSHTFVIRGEVFRDAVTRALGMRSVKSTLFSVKRIGDRFVFSGRGYGHGVGLCQAGALVRIRSGASTVDVIQHYFPGTRIGF